MEKDYIPLSRNLLNDPKIKALQKRYGKAAGVGHWVIMLLEMYANSRSSIDTNVGYLTMSLQDDHGIGESEFMELCDICADLTLIDDLLWNEGKQICNAHVNEQKSYIEDIKRKRSEAGRKGGLSKR